MAGTDPHEHDTDQDGAMDGEDFAPLNPQYSFDADRDGLPVEWELQYGLDDNNDSAQGNISHDASLDFDHDGLSNRQEFLAGTHPHEQDTDQDGAMDGDDFAPLNPQYSFDTDRDGLPQEWEQQNELHDTNPADASEDYDGDWLTNAQEYIAGTNPNEGDTDRDGALDGEDFAPLNPQYSFDEDRDGLPIEWESQYGFADHFPLDAQEDIDGDNFTNRQEFVAGTDPRESDTDRDGAWDGEDFAPLNPQYSFDWDRDGLPVEWEQQFGLNDFDATDDPWEVNSRDGALDLDSDGLTNRQEFLAGTHPHESDTDQDGASDSDDFAPLNPQYSFDWDKDGLPQEWENEHGFFDHFPLDAQEDADGDLFTNLQEFTAGTDPHTPDTDSDGVDDGLDVAPLNSAYRFDNDKDGLPEAWELQHSLNDFDAFDAMMDFDLDGLTNLQEFLAGTDPHNPDSNFDGIGDGQVAF